MKCNQIKGVKVAGSLRLNKLNANPFEAFAKPKQLEMMKRFDQSCALISVFSAIIKFD